MIMAKKRDENETAFDALQELLRRDRKRDGLSVDPIPEKEKDPHHVEAGRLGGLKGGPARKKKLSKKQRSDIAKKAAKARWNKKNK